MPNRLSLNPLRLFDFKGSLFLSLFVGATRPTTVIVAVANTTTATTATTAAAAADIANVMIIIILAARPFDRVTESLSSLSDARPRFWDDSL